MTQKVFVDRSRYETYQRCNRARFLGYHFAGRGIQSARTPLPLAVGSSVHKGLAHLVKEGQELVDRYPGMPMGGPPWVEIEEEAVIVALHDFAQYENAVDVDTGEITARSTLPADAPALSEMDAYLWREQCALVEAMVRAYSRRRLRPLLEQFEVLEVEREGKWLLHAEGRYCPDCGSRQSEDQKEYDQDCKCGSSRNWGPIEPALWFMSRPDALLRERQSNELYLLSYKTTGAWDIRKARDAEHDMQGLSEGIEIERRLAEWYATVQRAFANPSYVDSHWGQVAAQRQVDVAQKFCDVNIPLPMRNYLRALPAPPRIHAVRMEFLLKGERWKDKDLSLHFGCEMRSQRSHLIRTYEAVSVPMRGSAGYNIGDRCWSWDYLRDDGRDGSLAWQNWKSRAIWEAGPNAIRDWIDALDDAAPTMSGEDATVGLEPRLLGYKCDAQAVGVTREHPLDAVFVPPITIYRNEDDLRDLVDQMEAQERRIAEGDAAVNEAADEGERRHALNVHFSMNRHACEFPSTCSFVKLCYAGEDMKRDPVGSGQYRVRVPNHPQEVSANDRQAG